MKFVENLCNVEWMDNKKKIIKKLLRMCYIHVCRRFQVVHKKKIAKN